MPYPVAREHPDSTPCVKKLRGSNVGVRDAAKNSVPRRRPLVEIECHSPLAIWPHLSIPGERQLRPAACREAIDFYHWGMRFCRKSSKDYFGFLTRGRT